MLPSCFETFFTLFSTSANPLDFTSTTVSLFSLLSAVAILFILFAATDAFPIPIFNVFVFIPSSAFLTSDIAVNADLLSTIIVTFSRNVGAN